MTATTTYATCRAALKALLVASADANFAAVAWIAGNPPSAFAIPPSEAQGYIWVDSSAPLSTNALVAEITCGVRVYAVMPQRVDASTPADPSILEGVASGILDAIAPGTAPASGPWYWTVAHVQFEHDDGYVEATVVGTIWNDGAIGSGNA